MSNTQTTTMIKRENLLAFIDTKIEALTATRNGSTIEYRTTGNVEFDRRANECNLQINAYRIVTSYVEAMQPYPVNATADGKPLPTPALHAPVTVAVEVAPTPESTAPMPDPTPDATAHFSDLIHRKNNATLKDLTVVTLRDAHYDVLNTVDELKRQIARLEALDAAIKQVVVVS